MATTRIISVHVNQGKTIADCLTDRIDYSKNPEKTQGGELISSYECDPKTADAEFLYSKRQYQTITGREQRHNVIAYQVRQSFKPGEITPEDANRIGYEVALLEHTLEEFLGFRKRHRAVVVGAGSLGKALIQDSGLVDYGMEIVAAFDVNPRLIDTERYGIRIYDVAQLREVCREVKAGIGIVTVPVEYAQGSADALIEAGVKAIWNFTPYRISVPENVVITNTSIYAHLAVMYNRMG